MGPINKENLSVEKKKDKLYLQKCNNGAHLKAKANGLSRYI